MNRLYFVGITTVFVYIQKCFVKISTPTSTIGTLTGTEKKVGETNTGGEQPAQVCGTCTTIKEEI